MTNELVAYLAHARLVPADQRAELTASWSTAAPAGSVLLSTCHRVELYGSSASMDVGVSTPGDIVVARGTDVARHLVSLAVGRESTVLGEDQVLHQLRRSVHEARHAHPLVPELDRALDLALRAGRVARSWLPANRPTLVDVAIERATGQADLSGAAVHVVGSGEMGRRALVTLLRRGASVTISSRTRENARSLGARHGVTDLELDPGASIIGRVAGVVVALSGTWVLADESRRALADSNAWLIDLSAPAALDAELATTLGDRMTAIDDVVLPAGPPASAATLARLEALIEGSVKSYEAWLADRDQRAAADALAQRAREVRGAELDRLWRRMPSLDAAQRAAVERAVEHLMERLLRDPLEQLRNDHDGSHARAARQLFRL